MERETGNAMAAGNESMRSWPRATANAAELRREESDAGDALLRFLSRLSRFGLAASPDPLLKPAKPAR